MKKLISGFQLTFDDTHEVEILKNTNQDKLKEYIYHGQLDSFVSAHGIGRSSGSWGVYEGKFIHGLPNGYGRLIDQNLNVYEGNFKNG